MEIRQRHDAVKELEKSLLEVQEVRRSALAHTSSLFSFLLPCRVHMCMLNGWHMHVAPSKSPVRGDWTVVVCMLESPRSPPTHRNVDKHAAHHAQA